jgi:hypothetical protein
LTEIESAGPAPSGPAVLDIGGGMGAHTHTGVHERFLHGESLLVALFPSLSAGRWTLWAEGPCPTMNVEILDGQVTEVDWR